MTRDKTKTRFLLKDEGQETKQQKTKDKDKDNDNDTYKGKD
jgi:hypothetical protein